MFDVETGIPIPRAPRGRVQKKKRAYYPFEDMNIGDSFFVPADPMEYQKVWETLRKSIEGQRVRQSRYFTMRQYRSASGELGIRVWKISKPRGEHRITA